MVLLLCILFYFLYKCGNFVRFFFFFEGGGRGASQSTPGSSSITIYDHIFLVHLNNGPGFYKLYLQGGTLSIFLKGEGGSANLGYSLWIEYTIYTKNIMVNV